ncbi:MAG TPA: DMT family transporter [Ktedonobacterales bacterium]
MDDGRGAGKPSGMVRIHLAVLLFGLAGVLGKLSGLPAPLIVLARVALAGPALLLWLRWRGPPARVRVPPRHRAIFAAQGVVLAVHWTAFFQSINLSSVAIGLLSFSSFPLFTAALEPLLTRRRPSRAQLLAALLVGVGVYLLVPRFSWSSRDAQGVAWGLLAGFTFALLSVVNRWLGATYPSVLISAWQDLTAAVVLLPALLFLHPTRPFTVRELVILLVLGLACTAAAHTLFIAGMRTVSAQLASLIAALEPVWGILFALALLREVPTARTLAGGALILGAVLGAAALARRAPSVAVVQGCPTPQPPEGASRTAE